MKNKDMALCACTLLLLTLGPTAWAQWSSNPARNLTVAGRTNNDQVQPKLRPLPDSEWYVSWFDANGNSPPPVGYDVLLQQLTAGGVKVFPNYRVTVADLTNSSTEDYGLDMDAAGNALLAFLDTREGANQQVTAAKIDPTGAALWGKKGIQLTQGNATSNAVPKIAGTTDGDAVVAWTSNTDVMVQKLDADGKPAWSMPIVFSEAGYSYILADMKASDHGSVIVSWVREQGFEGDKQLRANKISADGKLLWGSQNVTIFDEGSLQFGNFPYFITDGNGGAVFSWYTAIPTLQCYAQHIRADGTEAFPHNGAVGSTNATNVRVAPSVSYRQQDDETFMFWTEEDSLQVFNGVYGQRFNGRGVAQWGPTGLVVVPLGANTQTFVETVTVGPNALVMWVDSPGYGLDTIQAVKLDEAGYQVCAQFPVSTAPSSKFGLTAATAPNSLTALAWADDRIGNNSIYIQNIHPDCSL